ncbi:NAD(P)H-binding protein [Streptomyces diastaticus]|uniref:NmrA family protein n=1 Tax=Streptomyces diastaticus subsp. diastaticus TaxID=68040 RepID=A0ABQ1CY36_STRDI|nr:NAD(P)H-binding protein [Streptomyces diastaticus]GFH75246.1 NmrA family protein [Streptomyces diastaticus subsp. diastaticus]GGU44358.1 NmrA family protein [Streptomyces diastaticus subsp. diastaticus]
METEPTLVLGATGSVGRRVAARLDALGAHVRPATRNSATRFDWDDQRTWKPALNGVSRLFLMSPDGVPVAPGFVQMAVELGVERMVLLSSRAIETIGDERLLDAERLVRTSGADWTVVRSDWFDQNFDEGHFRTAVRDGRLTVPLGDCRQAFADLDDVADVIALALREDGHTGRTYEVTGPHALSFGEACEVISARTGRPLEFRGEPEDYRAFMTSLGRPEEEVEGEIAAFDALRALGDGKPLDTVPRLLGRSARSFEEYVASVPADRW